MLQVNDLMQEARQAAEAAGQDSTSAIEDVGGQIRGVGNLILDGEWSLALSQAGDGLRAWVEHTLPNLIAALFVGIVAFLVFRLAQFGITQLLRRTTRVESGVRDLLLSGLNLLGWTFVILLALTQIGLDLATAVAGLGILGLALGFAAKDALENLISGVMIMIDRPFRVGDTVEIEGERGRVVGFTLRSTRILTRSERAVVMPNIKMINQKLTNHSKNSQIRIDVNFGIAYKESIPEAREAVLRTTEGDARVLDDPPPEVVVVELGDSSIDLQLRLYAASPQLEPDLVVEYLERVRIALMEASIEIPFPHLQLFIDRAEGLVRDGVTIRPTEPTGVGGRER